jgi:transcriptional regulator with XRE-family HTH domain
MNEFHRRYREYLNQAQRFRVKVNQLAQEGVPQSDIARKLGVSRQRINQILNDAAHRARAAVAQAVKIGKLPKPSTLKCVDCGVRASQYDHRDYAKRREVEPVCAKCNTKRGYGKNGNDGKLPRLPQGERMRIMGLLGGKARDRKLSKARKIEIARMGGKARHAKKNGQ